jgi:hypothetical protein
MKPKIMLTMMILIISCSMVFAQNQTKSADNQSSTPKMEMAKDSIYYTCPMHKDVIKDKPGKCPKCGMDLVKKTIKKTEIKEALATYTCSMHPEVKSDKPGKCPKCGMELIVKK